MAGLVLKLDLIVDGSLRRTYASHTNRASSQFFVETSLYWTWSMYSIQSYCLSFDGSPLLEMEQRTKGHTGATTKPRPDGSCRKRNNVWLTHYPVWYLNTPAPASGSTIPAHIKIIRNSLLTTIQTSSNRATVKIASANKLPVSTHSSTRIPQAQPTISASSIPPFYRTNHVEHAPPAQSGPGGQNQ